MPYRRVGKVVQHKKGGKWSKKQTCASPAAAKRAMDLLRGVEHGWKSTSRPARKQTRRKTTSKSRKRR